MKALAFSLVSVAFMSLVLTACGKDDDDEESTPTSSYTYETNTKLIITENCATSNCHTSGSAIKGLTTLAEVKAMGTSKMSTRIQATDSTVMPPTKTDFKTSSDGKILLDWLAGGADLK